MASLGHGVHTMKTEHVMERSGHMIGRLGFWAVIGAVIYTCSHPDGMIWPVVLAGGLIVVGLLLELRGLQLRCRN